MDYQNLRMRAAYLNGQVMNIRKSLNGQVIDYKELEERYKGTLEKEENLAEALMRFKMIVEKFSMGHIKEIEALVTLSLSTVFYDKDYKFVIRVTDKRNSKYADLYLVDGETEVPLYNGQIAGGILSVIGLVLQIYSLSYLGLSPVIFLDEALSQISSEYLPGLFELLGKMKERTGLIIVLISHDPRFREYAERIYEADGGVFREVERKEVLV